VAGQLERLAAFYINIEEKKSNEKSTGARKKCDTQITGRRGAPPKGRRRHAGNYFNVCTAAQRRLSEPTAGRMPHGERGNTRGGGGGGGGGRRRSGAGLQENISRAALHKKR